MKLFSRDWWLVCIGVTAIPLVTRLGDLAVGVYLLCCIYLFWRNLRPSLSTLFHFLPLLAFPALGLFSTIWSEAPDISKKQSAELILYVVTAIVLCRRMRLNEMALVIQLATLLTCALCLAVEPNAFKGAPLVGFMGSKNQMSFTAQILLISSLATVFDAKMPRALRLLAAASVGLGGLEIHLAQSAGGLLSTVAAATVFLGLVLIERLRLPQRLAITIGGLLSVSPLLFVISDVIQKVQDFQINVLHKDATLTGRTELWTFAQSLIAEKPILGHGFFAFWRQGNEDAEGLWRKFGIGNRGGFNFHNQFVDTQIDLGMVGLIVLLATLAGVAIPAIWRSIRHPSVGNAFGMAVLIALYLKLPVESILIGEWTIYNLVFIMVAVCGAGGAVVVQEQWGQRERPGVRESRQPPPLNAAVWRRAS